MVRDLEDIHAQKSEEASGGREAEGVGRGCGNRWNEGGVGRRAQQLRLPLTFHLQTFEASVSYEFKTPVKFWTIAEEKCLNIFSILRPVTMTRY